MFLKFLGFCHSKHTSCCERQYPTVIEELCRPFSLEDLKKATNNFDTSRVIGRGGFGKVYKGYLQLSGASDSMVAVKRLGNSRLQGNEEFKNEIELLCQLRHPNLVSLVGFCNHRKEKIIVYEYMSNLSLDRYLHGGDMEALSWKKRLEICIGTARGVHYLHTGAKRTIIHCDLKPSHILLDADMNPKLADFGFSIQGQRFMSKPKPIQLDSIKGTVDYMAREYALYGTITDRCDVYSFGMVLLNVASGRKSSMLTFDDERSKPAEENIDPSIKGKIAPECWEVFIDIAQRCLKLEPDERPTMGEVEVQLEHTLSLQQEADTKNINGDYTLFSTTNLFENINGDYTLFSTTNSFEMCGSDRAEYSDSDSDIEDRILDH